jgi:hypothetical protein
VENLPQLASAICDEFRGLPYQIFKDPDAQKLGRQLLDFCRDREASAARLKLDLERARDALDARLSKGQFADEAQRRDLEKLLELGGRALDLLVGSY